MAFEFFKESYTGSIKEIALGKGDNAVTVGGEACYPFYQFEGAMPNKPRIAMEIWDMAPEEWPEAAMAPFKDVLSDPAAWAANFNADYLYKLAKGQVEYDPLRFGGSQEDAERLGQTAANFKSAE